MALITIRQPTASFEAAAAESHRVGRPLAGLRLGVRQDATWRSWQVIAAAWIERLRRAGADPLPLQTGERTGVEGQRTRQALAAWTAAVDCAVVGLGTCGSCTMWSVRDAIEVEQLRKPVVAAICDEFVSHARTTAEFLGHPHLRLLVLPYPLEARPEEELRQIADEYFPKLLDLIGVIG